MPLLFQHKEPLWGVWKIEESPDELLSLLTRTADYVPFLESIRTENRKKEWLAVRVLTKELVGEETPIMYRPNGAPYLPEKDFHISISHTKGYVAVILSDQEPVGIDIEYRAERILKIRDKFLSKEENQAIDIEHEVEHLLLYWCAKETLFKIIGQGNVDFIAHLHVQPFSYKEEGSLIVRETRTEKAASYILDYRVFVDFMIVFSKIEQP